MKIRSQTDNIITMKVRSQSVKLSNLSGHDYFGMDGTTYMVTLDWTGGLSDKNE